MQKSEKSNAQIPGKTGGERETERQTETDLNSKPNEQMSRYLDIWVTHIHTYKHTRVNL